VTESLVDGDYWLNQWPAEPVALTRANAADGYPKPLTPLSQDIVLTYEEAGCRRFYFDTLGALGPGDCGRPFMQAYYGLVYLNADQMGDLGAAMPGSSRMGMYQTFFGLDPDPAFEGPKPSLGDRIKDAGAGLKIGPRILRLARTCAARIERQLADVDRARPEDPDKVSLAEAAAWLDRLEAMQTECWESLMIGAALGAAFHEATEKAVTRFVGNNGRDLTNRLHVGLGGNESAEAGRAVRTLAAAARAEPEVAAAIEASAPVEEILAAPAFAASFGEVISRFGHRAPAELELANPSWRADPRQLLDVVRIELHRPEQADNAASIRADAEAELDRRLGPIKRGLVRFVLARSRQFMALRENGKTPIVRVFDDTRRLLAAVTPSLIDTGVLRAPEDIYFLRYDELRQVLRGDPGPGGAEIERRRAAHALSLELDLPELVEAGPGWLRPLDDSFFIERGMLPPATSATITDTLTGMAASPGRVTATARVLLDPFDDFEPGDVLVAKTVDPGWAPVLSCAGAVVLDIGGVMSHGAVVARELGIPCVVNVKAGTEVVQTGTIITVDGSTGEVVLSA
jgi:phosphohistidine swiveling domain-containing protein